MGERSFQENVRRVRQQAVPLFAAALILLGASVVGGPVAAQSVPPAPSPSPSPSPSPAPTKTPKPPGRFSLKVSTYTSGTNNQMVGPGIAPLFGATKAFPTGGALGPSSPYDLFSNEPLATGEGISQDFLLTPTERLTPGIDASITFGYASAGGTGNVISYWGDALYPGINPHLGKQAFTTSPAFTNHNGQNPVSATQLGVLSGTLSSHDGNGALTIGWFNPHQYVDFAFKPAPWVNTPFALVPTIPESIGDGPPTVDVLAPGNNLFPLSGFDFWVKQDIQSYEIASADMASPSYAPARILTASAVIDHGAGLKYEAQLTNLNTAGTSTGRVLFGANTTLTNGVPLSTVSSQQMFIGGIGVTFPVGTIDAEARYGFSCYNATGVALPSGGCTTGNYYYAKAAHGFSSFNLAVSGVRFEPTYAPAILDYGQIENVLTFPAAFPNTWLRGNYQLVNNSEVGSNRQGVKVEATTIVAGVEARFAFGHYAQITPLDLANGFQPGFVEPYFLPQIINHGSIGTENHFTGWFNYKAKFANITLELSQVDTARSAPAGAPQDNVQMHYPSGVLSLDRPFGPKFSGAAGVGRFAFNGQFDTSGTNNANLSQNLIFAGLTYRANATTGYGLEYRLYSTDGNPELPGGPSPAFHGPQIQFYQRFKT